jgi:anti-sigma regulatory factor (Ser/Thr protein kinase)
MNVEWALPHDLSAARTARVHVAHDLALRGIPDALADDILLVASELAANAVRHGRPPARLRLDYSAGRVRVTVSNHGGSTDPQVIDAAPDAGHGRGLAITQAVADDVGWERDGDRVDVWAEFSVS